MTVRATDDVITREVAGEVFLVPIRGRLAELDELFVLSEVGQWLWSRLDGRSSVDDLVSGLVKEFDVEEQQARSDTEAFLRELVSVGLAKEEPAAEPE